MQAETMIQDPDFYIGNHLYKINKHQYFVHPITSFFHMHCGVFSTLRFTNGTKFKSRQRHLTSMSTSLSLDASPVKMKKHMLVESLCRNYVKN